jgi:hypothetical protein
MIEFQDTWNVGNLALIIDNGITAEGQRVQTSTDRFSPSNYVSNVLRIKWVIIPYLVRQLISEPTDQKYVDGES